MYKHKSDLIDPQCHEVIYMLLILNPVKFYKDQILKYLYNIHILYYLYKSLFLKLRVIIFEVKEDVEPNVRSHNVSTLR